MLIKKIATYAFDDTIHNGGDTCPICHESCPDVLMHCKRCNDGVKEVPGLAYIMEADMRFPKKGLFYVHHWCEPVDYWKATCAVTQQDITFCAAPPVCHYIHIGNKLFSTCTDCFKVWLLEAAHCPKCKKSIYDCMCDYGLPWLEAQKHKDN
jgi:hypothetical protein